MLKGYAITAHRDDIGAVSRGLLKYIFVATIIWAIYLISIILAYIVIIDENQNQYSNYTIIVFICLVVVIFVATIRFFYFQTVSKRSILDFSEVSFQFKRLIKHLCHYFIRFGTVYFEEFKKICTIAYGAKPIYLICAIIGTIVAIYLISISVVEIYSLPSYLLIGTYSMEEYSQPEISDIRIFVITETGITYKRIYIDLYKLNSSGDTFFDDKHSMIINGTSPTVGNEYMNGTKYEGKYYIYLNTSNLTSGNYILHAEVTDDLTKNSTFGANKKHIEKLFYVEQKDSNLALYNT